MYKRSIKLMFITQTNDFGSVIWKVEQHICQFKASKTDRHVLFGVLYNK